MKAVFKETQKFDNIWFFVILAVVSVINFVLYITVGETDLSSMMISYTAVLITGAIFLLFKLDTEINHHVIKFKFFPFHFKWQEIPWSDVSDAHVRKYKPIMEYGGWGLRYGKGGKAYNTRGNMGLQLTLKNGKKVLIGTQQADNLSYFLSRLKPSL